MKRFLCCALLVVACNDPPPAPAPAPAKPSATVAPAREPEATARPEGSAAPARPKKQLADCPKDSIVKFDDAAVELEVRRKTQKEQGDVLRSDVSKIRSLNFSSAKLTQLDPCLFRDLGNLRDLFLPPGDFEDLSLLVNCPELTALRASITKVRDLKPIETLVKLSRLDLGRTLVSDLEPLRKLVALTEVMLDDTPVTDLSPLEKHDLLARLSIQRTRVKDVSPLRELKALKFLYLEDAPVDDVSVLGPAQGRGLKIQR